MGYKEENKELLLTLQNQAYEEEIHSIRMLVKPIPDASKDSVLDPRVFKTLYENLSKPNPLAESACIPVDLIRQMPGYPNKDVTTGPITVTEEKIHSRNGEVGLKIYTPGIKENKPCILYFHGGAFIGGSLGIVENFCKALCELAEAVVISVDYRLAPENPFPAGLYDCFDAVNWAYENAKSLQINKEWIAVAGDSAGGGLATVCSLIDRDLGQHRVKFQALLYPSVLVDSFAMEDYKWRLKDYDIPVEDEVTMSAVVSLKALTAEMPYLYMGKEGHIKEPYAAPLCADSLEEIASTLIIASEFDYLRMQIEAYSRKLIRDGVEVRHIMYKGMDHGFIDKIGVYPQGYDAAVEIAREIKKRFS